MPKTNGDDQATPTTHPPLPNTPIYSGPSATNDSARSEDRSGVSAKAVGERIREKRVEKALTQRDLATQLGRRTRNWLTSIENGTHLPSTGLLSEIAQALDTTTDYLLYGTK